MKLPLHTAVVYPFLFFFGLPLLSVAQEDDYFDWLDDQLAQEYGLTGGTYLLANTEAAILNQSFATQGVQKEIISVEGQPFTQGVRLTTMDRLANFWERSIQFNINTPIAEGDALLVVAWIRGISGERGRGFVNHNFELGEAPFTNLGNQRMAPAGEWQQLLIPYEATLDLPRSWYKVNLGFQAQQVEMGGVVVLNFGESLSVDQLPASTHHLEYAGRAPDAPWRASAQTRIEEYRMAPFEVEVKDQMGNPLPDAEVSLRMQQHEFGFGTVVALFTWLQNSADAQTYRDKIMNLTGDGRTFNTIVLENAMKWEFWENDNWPGTQTQTVDLVNTLRNAGMQVRGHNLIWPGFQWLPDDIGSNQNNADYVRQRIEDHIRDIMAREGFQGQLSEWDILNEPVHLTDLRDVFGTEDIYAEWFNLARQLDPNARQYINEYDIIVNQASNITLQEQYLQLIQDIEADGATIDGIGMQGHFNTTMTAPETVLDLLDEFAELGKKISITEYDTRNIPDTLAADYMRDFLTAIFSHPSVENFLMWGIYDPIHWLDDAPMFRADWSLKPAGEQFIDLVFNQWWTNTDGQTDASGQWSERAFLGTYEVMVTAGGQTITETVQLTPDMDPVEIVVDLTTSTEDLSTHSSLLVHNLYPNPTRDQVQLTYQLRQGGHVDLFLTDALGRTVHQQQIQHPGAGRYNESVDLSDLPAGTYWLRLATDEGTVTQPIFRL